MDNQMTPAGAAIESTPCTWIEDADDNWRTGCNEIHIIIDGTLSENGYVYCPYCGLKIETVIYNAPHQARANRGQTDMKWRVKYWRHGHCQKSCGLV